MLFRSNSLTSKLQRTAGNIAFTSKCLKHRLIPTFAKVNGNFHNNQHRYAASKKILDANLCEQHLKLRLLVTSLRDLEKKIVNYHGRGALKLLQKMTHKLLSSERFQSLKTKNKKINNLRSNHKIGRASCRERV